MAKEQNYPNENSSINFDALVAHGYNVPIPGKLIITNILFGEMQYNDKIINTIYLNIPLKTDSLTIDPGITIVNTSGVAIKYTLDIGEEDCTFDVNAIFTNSDVNPVTLFGVCSEGFTE